MKLFSLPLFWTCLIIYNEYLKTNITVKDKIIDWNGKKARLQIISIPE